MKILYVCPFAHYSGHHPHVSGIEPQALADIGHDVTLLTFQGIINDTKVSVKHLQVINSERMKKLLYDSRQYTLLRWWLMVFETLTTIAKGLIISKQYDVLYVRDGDPFLFAILSLSLLYWRKLDIVVSVTGSAIFAPKIKHWWKRPLSTIYTVALYMIVSPVWKPVYAGCIKYHHVKMIAQNDKVMTAFQSRANGVFKDVMYKVSRGVLEDVKPLDKATARERLGLTDRFTLLSFGAPHQGKNLDVVFKAVGQVEECQIVHGGMHNYSLGGNPAEKNYDRLEGI